MLVSSWMIHRLTRKRRTGLGSKGDPVYGPAEFVMARAEFVMKMVRGADGKEVVSSCTVTMLDAPKIDDVYWFPSIAGSVADDTANGDAGRSPISVAGASNKLGSQHLWMAYFG
jgi:hypothetical protein